MLIRNVLSAISEQTEIKYMYIELVMREEQLLVQELYIKSPAVPARLHPLNLPWTNIKTIVSLINDSQNGKYISSMDSVRVEVL